MARRLPASMRTREELSALIEGRLASPAGRSALVELATRLIVEEALEGEARDTLGRDYYERGAEPGQGYRNGTRTGRLKTAEGNMTYSAPQVAGLDQPYRSAIRDHLKGQTEALESLAVEMLARGLSVRDIEDAFRDESGRLLLSKTAVAEMGEQLWEDYQAFKSRDLGEYEIAYLFIDGIAERLRPGQKREPVLAAWGFTLYGRKVLLHLMAGSKEDGETVSAFFQDMRARGLGDRLVKNQRTFDLGRPHSVPRDVHDVVDATGYPVVAVLVTARPVTGEVEPLVRRVVRIDDPLMVAVDRSDLAGPGSGDHEVARRRRLLDDVAFRVDECGFDAEKGSRRGTGFELCGAW